MVLKRGSRDTMTHSNMTRVILMVVVTGPQTESRSTMTVSSMTAGVITMAIETDHLTGSRSTMRGNSMTTEVRRTVNVIGLWTESPIMNAGMRIMVSGTCLQTESQDTLTIDSMIAGVRFLVCEKGFLKEGRIITANQINNMTAMANVTCLQISPTGDILAALHL